MSARRERRASGPAPVEPGLHGLFSDILDVPDGALDPGACLDEEPAARPAAAGSRSLYGTIASRSEQVLSRSQASSAQTMPS